MDYAAKAVRARDLIHKNGGLIQFTQPAVETYNPLNRTRTNHTPQIFEVYAIIGETNKVAANTFVAGTQEYSRMRDLMIAALDLPYGINIATDRFTFENAVWRIITFEILAPDGVTKIMYTVTVGT